MTVKHAILWYEYELLLLVSNVRTMSTADLRGVGHATLARARLLLQNATGGAGAGTGTETAERLHAAFAEFEKAHGIFTSIAADTTRTTGSSAAAAAGGSGAEEMVRQIANEMSLITRRFRDNPFMALRIQPMQDKSKVKKAYFKLAKLCVLYTHTLTACLCLDCCFFCFCVQLCLPSTSSRRVAPCGVF